MRIAWEADVGLRAPIAWITSPLLSGRLESAGALTTKTPSLVPKYSPRSGLRLTSSMSHQASPKQNENPPSCGSMSIT